jgi:hypothetical protein
VLRCAAQVDAELEALRQKQQQLAAAATQDPLQAGTAGGRRERSEVEALSGG